MDKAAFIKRTTTECGFCLRQEQALQDPKVLPCKHVHCLECLTAYFDVNHLLQCPLADCREVVNGPADRLPSYHAREDNTRECHTCIDKTTDSKPAVIYCTTCDKMYCDKHEQTHDQLHKDHTKLSMDEYASTDVTPQIRNCTEHINEPYSMGCKVCLTLVCPQCRISGVGNCGDDSEHELLPLDEMVTVLVEENVNAAMIAKEDALERLFKLTSKARCEHDVKTTEMVQLLHKSRDLPTDDSNKTEKKKIKTEQLGMINDKYDKLERELIKKWQTTSIQIAEFLEDIVLAKWTNLRNHRLRIESSLKHMHKVDIVNRFLEIKAEVQSLLGEDLPCLKLDNVVELVPSVMDEDINLKLTLSAYLVINSEHGLTTSQSLPTSLTLLADLHIPGYPLSVCEYEGDIYVGMDGDSIAKIDSDYGIHESFIYCYGKVLSIVVYKNRIYTLLSNESRPYSVTVYDMSGEQIIDWEHSSITCWNRNMLAVVSDQVVIPDPPNNQIITYSLDGTKLKHISCPAIGDASISVCSLDDASIIISDYGLSQLSRMSISTGEVVWTCQAVHQPMAATCYTSRYTVVTKYDKVKKISILDTKTGEVLSDITAPAMLSGAEGISAIGNTLVLALYSYSKVVFYRIDN